MEWLINRRRMMYNKAVPPAYLTFEDNEFWQKICIHYGDYYQIDVTDNGNNTVNILVTFKSALAKINGTYQTVEIKKSIVDTTRSRTNVDNTGGEYTIGTTYEAVGITKKQCEAVGQIGTMFDKDSNLYSIKDILHFTSINYAHTYMFRQTSISEIYWPDSPLVNLPTGLFAQCNNLTTAIVREGIESVNQIFYGCSNLEVAVFPTTITSITGQAFITATNLHLIVKAVVPPTLGSNTLDRTLSASGAFICVPDESVEAYKTAQYWSNKSSIIIGKSDLPSEYSQYWT